MSLQSITDFSPEVKTIEISGRTYELWHEAGRYYVKSLATGKLAQLDDLDSLGRFMTGLRIRLMARVQEVA